MLDIVSLSGANAGMGLAFGLPLHLTFFGLCALLGLLVSLFLMRRTSIMAGLERDRVLDAAVFALIAAFALSRIMLVASDPQDFVKYPLLVLGLPSLSYTAIILTAIAVALYLRRQRLPLRPVLDAWAPCVAIFFAAVSVGHFLEGTILGMPTTLPWGIYVPRLGRVHPVEIYAAAAATFLCAGLLWLLSRPHAAAA
jgi:phosphatidylglycerol:prolipoprotein diacylglycerol transferase